MKRFFCSCILTGVIIYSAAQPVYDSITISRSTIENNWYGANWKDSLKAGRIERYITQERIAWVKPGKVEKKSPPIVSLTNQIKSNGTGDVSKCFIPRHSINFYKGGKIVRYVMVCFECDGVRFSDEPARTFIKSVETRDKQMTELKTIFRDIL